MKRLKGIAITSELLLALGAIIAAIVFFMVGSGMVGFQVGQFFSFSETRVLTDLTNRIDRASGESGLTKIQYDMPVGTYTLKAGGNSLNFKTPNSKLKKSKLYGLEISDTEVRDEKYICVTIENSSIDIKGGECEGLGPSSSFCANSRCVDGVCQPEYGEDCKNPDCSCDTVCCPGAGEGDLNEKNCLKTGSFKNKEKGASCPCPELCKPTLNCNPTISGFDSFSKACCSDKTMWNGSECRKLKEGEKCPGNEWCKAGLECNPTVPDYHEYDKACCASGEGWNGTHCTSLICPSSISQCYNQWHWNNKGEPFEMNINGKSCDYIETCYTPIVEKIAKEVKSCCKNKCSGGCHSLCNKAVSNSGLSSTDTPQTRKKCYGLYTIYGLGPAARWLQGYKIHTEEPASTMLDHGTWMCTGYSIEVTTLLRSVGYNNKEVLSTVGPGHAYNLVKLPGESKYRFVDTVGNSLYISGITGKDWYRRKKGHCRTNWERPCQNDEVYGYNYCPSDSEIILGDGC